jgi:hypothetical protein
MAYRMIYLFDADGYFIDEQERHDSVETPSNATEVAPDPTIQYPKFDGTEWVDGKTSADILAIYKSSRLDELKIDCSNAIYAGFTSSVTDAGGVALEFGYNDRDQLNFNGRLNKINLWKNQLLNGAITQADYDAKFPLQWKSTNKGVVSLTEAEFVQLMDDAEAHQLTQQKKYWTLEAQVNAATSQADVDKVVW